jgi:hypothetical protein
VTSRVPFAALLARLMGDNERFGRCLVGVLAARHGFVLGTCCHHLHPVSPGRLRSRGVGTSHLRTALYPADTRAEPRAPAVIPLLRRVIVATLATALEDWLGPFGGES